MNQKWIEPATLENAIARLEPPAPGHHDALGRLKNRSDMKTPTSGVPGSHPETASPFAVNPLAITEGFP